MNIMNDSFVKRIKRNECIVCGCGANSGGSYWPDGESGSIRLYQGLPMCWECASKIFVQYTLYGNVNGWEVTPSEWYDRIVDPTKASMSTQEHQFEEQCERWKEFDIVDTSSDVTDTVIVQGMERDNIYDMKYIHDAVCDRLEDIMSCKRPEGTQYDIILREIIPNEKYFSLSISSRYRDQLREYCESHPEDFPTDGYPVIISKKEQNGSVIAPIDAFAAPSEWAGKVTQIKWASDGDYHGIDKAIVRWLPTASGKILHDMFKEDMTLVPVMMGYAVGSPTNDFDIHRLVGFAFILKPSREV